ncbi:MAG: glycoside hydrolase family 25 protein [Anaerolineae bacterium]|nr:glycoside hydrolase family 25 protein [Anaerolineae bacterium]
MATVQGLDVSKWQDDNTTPQQIDFNKAKRAGAYFVFIKASQDVYADPDFAYNWNAAKTAGLIRGAYHFFDYRKSPKTQADYLASLLKDDWGELPPVLDFEKHPAWDLPTRDKCLRMIKEFFTQLETTCPKKPLFYTNPSMIKYTLSPIPDWLLEHPLWIAHYYVSAPSYKPWAKWHFWQYSDRGDGLAYGMESLQVDMNWWNGTLEELHQFANLEPPPPPPPTLEERLAKLEAEARAHGWNV